MFMLEREMEIMMLIKALSIWDMHFSMMKQSVEQLSTKLQAPLGAKAATNCKSVK